MKFRTVLHRRAEAVDAAQVSRPKIKWRSYFFFLAVLRLGAFFLVAFFAAFFLVAFFFVAFLAVFFLATFFLAAFFFATFFLAITFLLQADHKQMLCVLTLLGNTKITGDIHIEHYYAK